MHRIISWRATLASVALALSTTSLAWADIPPSPSPEPGGRSGPTEPVAPTPSPSKSDVTIRVYQDVNAKNVRIVLPATLVRELGEFGAAPSGTSGQTRTMLAGLALSAAAVSLLFVRRKNRTVKAVTTCVFAAAGIAALYSSGYADIALPGEAKVRTPVSAARLTHTFAKATVEVSTDARDVLIFQPPTGVGSRAPMRRERLRALGQRALEAAENLQPAAAPAATEETIPADVFGPSAPAPTAPPPPVPAN